MPRRRNRNRNNNNRRRRRNNARKNVGKRSGRSTLIRQVFGRQGWEQMNYLPVWIESPMRYADEYAVSVTSGSVVDQIYRANSLFDPDRTNIGHQPYGFDQMAASYNKYIVDKLEWYIEFPSSSDVVHYAVGLVNGSNAYSTLTDYLTFKESPTIRTGTTGFGGSTPWIATGKKLLPNFNGVGHRQYFEELSIFGANVTTNPVEVIDLHIVIYNPSATTVNVKYSVSLKYRAIFLDPFLPNQSLHKEKIQKSLLNRPSLTRDSLAVVVLPEGAFSDLESDSI